jgi:hypothetical protein
MLFYQIFHRPRLATPSGRGGMGTVTVAGMNISCSLVHKSLNRARLPEQAATVKAGKRTPILDAYIVHIPFVIIMSPETLFQKTGDDNVNITLVWVLACREVGQF